MIESSNLDHAIAAHAKWKSRLRQAIRSGQSDWSVESLRPDDHCDFGRWLNDLPLADRLSPEWREAKALHAQFHHLAADVLHSTLTGRTAEAEASLTPGGAFSVASSKLVKVLTDWKTQIARRPHP